MSTGVGRRIYGGRRAKNSSPLSRDRRTCWYARKISGSFRNAFLRFWKLSEFWVFGWTGGRESMEPPPASKVFPNSQSSRRRHTIARRYEVGGRNTVGTATNTSAI